MSNETDKEVSRIGQIILLGIAIYIISLFVIFSLPSKNGNSDYTDSKRKNDSLSSEMLKLQIIKLKNELNKEK